VIRTAIGIAILAVLASFLDLSEITSAIENAKPVYVLIALALVVPNVFVQMLKWRILLRSVDPSATFHAVSSSFFFGLAIGTLTPGQIGEFGGRALRIENERPGLIVGLTVIDKLQFMAVIIVGGLWSLTFLLDTQRIVLIVLSGLVTVCLTALALSPPIVTWVLVRLGIQKVRRQVIKDIVESFSAVPQKTLNLSLLLTLLLYVIVLGQFFLLLFSFCKASVLDASMGFAAALFAKSALPISIGDLGVREAAAVFFLSLRDVPEAASFDASFLLTVINIFLPALVGALFVPKKVSLKHWRAKSEEGTQ